MNEVGVAVLGGGFVTLVYLKSWLQPCIHECLITLDVVCYDPWLK